MDEYYAYIDEAGDEGFGKLKTADCGGQSRWLMLGAILVSKENDRNLPKWRDEIRAMFPERRARDLHFNKLKHDQRVAACEYLADKRIGACVVCSDKLTIADLPSQKLTAYKQKGHLYNYLVRLALERLTEACAKKSNGRPCKLVVTFSRRGGTDYKIMRDYLFLLRDGKEKFTPIRSIDWNVLNPEDIQVEDHANRAGLQLADVITSATYAAFEENKFGYTEPRYALSLTKRYLVERSKIFNCGIKIVPNGIAFSTQQLEFINKIR